MNKETKKTMVPKLRFQEFQEAGEWPYKNGDKVFNQVSNKNHNSDLPILAITQEHGAIPRNLIDYSVSVTDKSIESYKVIDVGDFIISLRSFQGGIEYSNYKGICSPAYIILRKKIDIEDHFFKFYFKTDLFIQDLNKNLEGLRDGKMVSYKQFSELFLPSPSKPEQQKIAAFLSSFDDLITAQNEKLQSLQAHKKGLMQQLFPAEGETVPRLRFREFEGSGEWEEKSIQDLIDDKAIISHLDGNHGALYPRPEEFSQAGVPYITANDFILGFVNFEKCRYLPQNRALQFKKGVAKDGDILFAHNATVGPVAKLSTNLPFVILSTTATYFRCNNNLLLNDFLKVSLVSFGFVNQYTRVMSQSTRNQVPITTQRMFNLQIPVIGGV